MYKYSSCEHSFRSLAHGRFGYLAVKPTNKLYVLLLPIGSGGRTCLGIRTVSTYLGSHQYLVSLFPYQTRNIIVTRTTTHGEEAITASGTNPAVHDRPGPQHLGKARQ